MQDFRYDNKNKLLKNDNFLNNQNYFFGNYEKGRVLDSLSILKMNKILRLGIAIFLVTIYLGVLILSSFFLPEKTLIVILFLMIYGHIFGFVYINKVLSTNKAKRYLYSSKRLMFKVNPKSSLPEVGIEGKSTLSKGDIELQIIKEYLFSENIYKKINIVKEKKEIYRRKYGKVKTEKTDSGHKVIY